MATYKSPQEAINDFVEAITQHYIAVQTRLKGADKESVTEEFVSAIETDLKTTLRQRLSRIDTVKDVEETPTVELYAANVRANSGQGGSIDGELGATIDSASNVHLTSLRGDGNHVIVDTPTLDSGAAASSAVEDLTLDSDAAPETMDSGDPSPQSASKRSVRTGKSNHSQALSYDVSSGSSGNGSATAGTRPDAPSDYEILSTLGKGGMGVVYKARHVPLNRLVAIKMILSGANASEEQLSRFQREAEAAAHLKHPNIVSVYEVGMHKGSPYFSLEFVEGESVSDLMKQTTLSPRDAAKLLIPVARAVDYSHKMGVLHRDLKPQNILLSPDGTPKVADFGLAKRLDADEDDHEKTREGVILGTPGYMAPEQAREMHRVGPHTDVYALGCILYYLMTGRPPFKAPTPFETVRQMLMQEPLAPSKLQEGLDKDLETICLKCLEKEIDKRYATAGEFADELQRFLDGKPIIARAITRRERVWKWCKRNPKVATLSGTAASLLFCLMFGGIISAIVINEEKKKEQIARHDAETNEVRAREQGELAADTTRLLLYKTRDFFEANPELRELRKPLMDLVVEGAEKIYTDNKKYNVNAVFTASADLQLGRIALNAGALDEARDKLIKAESELKKLRSEGELFNADISQMNISMALGDTYRLLGEMDKAEAQYLSLEKQRLDYFQDNPRFSQHQRDASLAEVYGLLATTYRLLGKPEKELDYNLRTVKTRRAAVDRAPESTEALGNLAGALTKLSASYENAGEVEKMLDASSEALSIQQRLGKISANTATRHNTAKDQKVVARQYLMLGKNEEAAPLLQSSTSTLDELIALSDDQRIQNQAIDAHLWNGVAQQRLGRDASASFARAEKLQRQMIEKSDNINSQGVLLKILARSGKTDEAIALADKIASSPEKMMNCGYAACGYGLIAERLQDDDPRKQEITDKAIDLTRKLIRHGYHDFSAMRDTDLDFEPLQKNPAFLTMLAEEEAKLATAKEEEATEDSS